MNARCKKIMLVATVAMFGLAGVTPARAETKGRTTAAERPLAPASPPESVGRSEPAVDLDAVVDKMLGHHHDHEGKAKPDSAKEHARRHECAEAFRVVNGQGRSCRTRNGMWKVDLGSGRYTITHGPDAIKPFESGQTGVLNGTPRAPVCAARNPHGSYGMLAVLAYPTDVTPNETVAPIRARIAAINGAFYQAAVESGSPNGANLVYECDSTGQTRVDVVKLNITAAQTSFSAITQGLMARGYTSGKLSVYWEVSAQYGGEGTWADDEIDSASNQSNATTFYSAPFFAINYNQTNEVWMHEIGHNLGAVGKNAPYSTGDGAHCHEGKDVMCYTDGGSKDPGFITWNCNDSFDHFDCNHDTYFDAAIGAGQGQGAGSYLDTRWNIGECYVRWIVNAKCGGSDSTPPTMGATTAAVAPGYQVGSTVPTMIQWSATDASGIGAYNVWVSVNGAAYTDVSAQLSTATAKSVVFSLTRGASYRFAARAKDAAGNWSDYTYTNTFTPKVFDDTAASYSTGWTRYAWSSALGGYEVGSSVTGATASFSFTGVGVACVAPKGTNRGQAYVYIDNAYVATVNLYAAATSATPIVFSRYWTTRGTHKVTIKVVGTSGRPQIDMDAFATLA